MKRIFSLVLLVALLVPIFINTIPSPVKAVTSVDEIRTSVTQKYEELLKTMNPGEGSGEGVMQLINHAMSGGGADLIMDEQDYFTGMAFHSNMFRDAFVENMTAVFDKIVHNYDEKILLHSSLVYYDHQRSYTGTVVSEFIEYRDVSETRDPDYNEAINNSIIERLVRVGDYNGAKNTYDNGMILVTGGAVVHYTIERTQSSGHTASYHVSMRYQDNFDVTNMDYSGEGYDEEDVKLANTLSLLGKLMEIGGIFKPYHLEFLVDFTLSFDNDCPHQTNNFRWEHNGSDIASVSGAGLYVNTTERIDEVNSQTGEQLAPYYKLEKTARLCHNLPWTLEFRMKGTSGFIMGPSDTYGSGLPYLLKTHDHVHGGQSFIYTEISQESGREITKIGRNQYGVEFTKFGYSKTPWYTFRLENRVNADGSNMPYLFVDDVELGPMNDYYINKDSKNFDQFQKVEWFNGQDVSINYLFNKSFRFVPGISIEYIQIWENGKNNAPHSYYTTKTITPTCTGKGYVSHICSQCGDTWNDNFTNALGHTLGAYTKKNDKLHSRICSVCGEEQVDVHDIKNNACTLCDYSETKSVAGIWTTDLTLSAAELGVSAPDSVLRATLAFTGERKVSATWEAMDLTALRIFFRDMFVSSYYAMAYGSGITDIQQIEQFCMDSTGMSVSAYMDTIVTEEAMKAAFTPESTQGSYHYNSTQTAIYTDLAFMGVSPDSAKENSFTVGGGTLYLNAASWGKADYTFVCKAVN